MSSLITSLILVNNIFLVDDWHVFESGNIVGLDNEHGASYLDDIVDFQRVQGAYLSFSTQPEPSSIG